MPASYIAYAKGSGDAPSTTIATDSTLNVQVGDVLVGMAVFETGTTATCSVSDSAGNTFTAGTVRQHSTVGLYCFPFYCIVSVASASNTITATFSGSRDYRSVVVGQYRGLSSFAAESYDESVAATSISAPAVSLSAPGVVVGLLVAYSSRTFTTSHTERYDSASYSAGLLDRIETASGSYGVSATWSAGIEGILVAMGFNEPSVPNAPTGVTSGSVTAYSATASWTDNSSDETGFKVQYAPSPYSSWTTLSGSPAAADATSLATGNVLTPGDSYKFRVASTNANGDSAYVESGIFTATPLTFLRPIADTSNGAWTASSGSDRYALIDESSTNDADYISVASASTYKTRLTSVSDPGVNTDHSVVVRAKGDGSSQLTIALVQGDPTETAIASTTVTPTVSYANYTLTVTSGQAANITDYSLLYLKLTSL